MFLRTIPVSAVTFLLILSGCSTMHRTESSGGWRMPTWEKAAASAVKAAASPATWGPAVGAGLMQIGSADRDVSRWASRNTPLFGSRKGAETASDILVGTAAATDVITSALSRDRNLERGIVGFTAATVAGGTALGLKEAVGKRRPDGSDNESFPSAHAALAASLATSAAANIASLGLPASGECLADSGLVAVTAATAWARIEARKHYPSDVLAGMALGHFTGAFFNNAFFDGQAAVVPSVETSRSGAVLNLSGSF